MAPAIENSFAAPVFALKTGPRAQGISSFESSGTPPKIVPSPPTTPWAPFWNVLVGVPVRNFATAPLPTKASAAVLFLTVSIEDVTLTCADEFVPPPAVTVPPSVAEMSLRNTDTAIPTPTSPSS